jgi:acyl transferase domain-containing protein
MQIKKTVFMFCGQGSQYFQMGRSLFDDNAAFRGWMLKLDRIVERAAGRSVLHDLYAKDRSWSDSMDQTVLSHPAIFMVEYCLAQALIEAGIRPDATMGVSLGAFAAAATSGCIEVEDALTAVLSHALALEASCERGGMTAVLADPRLFTEAWLSDNCALAAVNFSGHFVVSAPLPALAHIEVDLRSRQVTHQRLPVEFAYHSEWIDGARHEFEAVSRSLRFRNAEIPMMCCASATLTACPSSDYLWQATRRQIRFHEAAAVMERDGPFRYVDVGPGGTLATFMKYCVAPNSTSSCHAVMSPFGRDAGNFNAITALRH